MYVCNCMHRQQRGSRSPRHAPGIEEVLRTTKAQLAAVQWGWVGTAGTTLYTSGLLLILRDVQVA